MRQRAADGHVHEQQAERRVFEPRRGAQIVELARQQQRADRHGRRLGDERPEDRADGQDRQPPRARRGTAETCDPAQRGLGKPDDGPRRGQRHDHHDKHRLGVVHRVVEVVRGGVPPQCVPRSPPAARWPRGRRRPRPPRQSAAAPPAGSAAAPGPGDGARSSWRCWTAWASAEKRAAANVWRIASTKMPVTTALNGLACSRAASVASRPPSTTG